MTRSTQHSAAAPLQSVVTSPVSTKQVRFGSIKIDGLDIAFREAGDRKNPKLVLLHGFPSSSHQYRNLIEALADDFYVIAPDYQGFGNSDAPDPASYKYTFDALSATMEKFLAAKGFTRYGMYVQDYGGPGRLSDRDAPSRSYRVADCAELECLRGGFYGGLGWHTWRSLEELFFRN